jgi:hypothetical protein
VLPSRLKSPRELGQYLHARPRWVAVVDTRRNLESCVHNRLVARRSVRLRSGPSCFIISPLLLVPHICAVADIGDVDQGVLLHSGEAAPDDQRLVKGKKVGTASHPLAPMWMLTRGAPRRAVVLTHAQRLDLL